jgi:S-adenosylmethionine:tRNA ribosyltransferase-isomerase
MSALPTDLFDYPLPERLIAQTPAARRDASRLLVVDRATRTISHHQFADLPTLLTPTDQLFRNNAAVLPARLHGVRPTGGAVECLLLQPSDAGEKTWWCLLRPGKKLPVGATFGRTDEFEASVVKRREDGAALVHFLHPRDENVVALARRLGRMPLPPYITREREDARDAEDRQRYQTVYADPARPVAAAAPTAGLHFTPALLERLATLGIEFREVTLHVGLGTFRPIQTTHVEDHAIHRETYEMPVATQQALFQPQGCRIAVGTTSLRAMEDFLSRQSQPLPHPWISEAGIFIHPPRTFLGVDALLTNFHQPRSTLLCLLAAFLTPGSLDGVQWFREIYAEAIARDYRFLSYGDAMFVR